MRIDYGGAVARVENENVNKDRVKQNHNTAARRSSPIQMECVFRTRKRPIANWRKSLRTFRYISSSHSLASTD
jgi:hypothetical protein